MSTTGYSSIDFGSWPLITQIVLLMLGFIGGSASSTSGGFKVVRASIVGKHAFLGVKSTLSPRGVYTLKMDNRPVDKDIIRNTLNYFGLYVLIIALSFFLISFADYNDGSSEGFVTNITAVVAAVSNVGPGFANVGPTFTYLDYSVFSKIVLMFDMLLGRLEIMPILLLFYPKAWKRV
jgi:trk system potassium uptake protein TrkH